jgi:hypothetical protein
VIVLGLDPSLTGFGWCIHRSDVSGPGRVLSKGVWRTRPSQVFVGRYIYLRESVGEVLGSRPEIEAVGVESPPFGETWSEGLYGLFLFVLEAVYVHRKDVVLFDPTSVKMLARMDPNIRKGSMGKGDMVDAAKADTSISKWDHNEADAYIVARSAARFWDFYAKRITEEELTPSEYRAFARTHKTRGGKLVQDGAVFKEGRRFFRFSVEDTP